MSKYNVTLDLNILNHLGINLYSNISAVLSEAVANAWDADAEEVGIELSINGSEDDFIIIRDNGNGMCLADINDKFLKIGYQKRLDADKGFSPLKKRPVMGRKGIGKLSLFSIANRIEIHSVKGTEKNGLILDLGKIQTEIKNQNQGSVGVYHPDEVDNANIIISKGTQIKLTNLRKRFRDLDKKLRTRIARRFSVLSDDFKIIIDTNEVTYEDREYFKSLQYIWHLSAENKRYYTTKKYTFAQETEVTKNVIYTAFAEDLFDAAEERTESKRLEGWIGSVHESGQLKDGTENLNKISLIVRGKVAKEDILPYIKEDRIFTKYLIGEIHADFLDDDDKRDIATSSRQDFNEDDPRFVALIYELTNLIKSDIANNWTVWRTEEATTKALKNPALDNWFKSLGKTHQKEAKKLFGKIGTLGVSFEKEQELFKHGVLAFERLRLTDSLDKLEEVTDALSPEFSEVFNTINDIEAALYHDIVEGRLEVIEGLDQKVSDDELEKVIQKYLYNHLWLLDPSWDRAVDVPAHMEKTVQIMFDKVNDSLTTEEKDGRLDIKYTTSANKHVIIELKRPSVRTDIFSLLQQSSKYITALTKMLQNSGEKNTGPIEVICVVGRPLNGWEDSHTRAQQLNMAAVQNTRVVLYSELVANSKKAYAAFLEKNKQVSSLRGVIESLKTAS